MSLEGENSGIRTSVCFRCQRIAGAFYLPDQGVFSGLDGLVGVFWERDMGG